MRVADPIIPIFEIFRSDDHRNQLSLPVGIESKITEDEAVNQIDSLGDSAATADQEIPVDIPVTDHDDEADNQFDFLKDLEDRAKQREVDYESLFRNKVLGKLSSDIKSRNSKRSAAKFLIESFGDSLNDYSFVSWLAKMLGLKPCRLKAIIKNAYKEFVPRNSMSSSSLQEIYNFWLKEENSIISNDRRNGRDVVKIPKATYLSKYGKLVDPNIEEEDVTLKKTNNIKRYIKAPRMVYTKNIKQLHLEFFKENPDSTCSRSTFVKYRPFYIEEPSEREKQSCLCIVCQNAHTKLAGINTFRRLE